MPIFMDRHDVEGASNEDVAGAHEKDLELQDEYNVRFLTYWFDRDRGSVFCLCDAPDEESLKKVHDLAHGLIPHDIIEVSLDDVNTFLGRIKDPEPQDDPSGKKVIPIDSAFRCILFTDLKDSTTMSRNLGDRAAIALLDHHDSLIRKALATHDGKEVKHTGDGIMTSFTDVNSSVKCAVEIQKAFREFNDNKPKVPLIVRIGINAGEPIERGDDLFGMTVQLAARICNHAEPGKTLVSGVVYELCDSTLDIKFLDAGRVHFKGFDHAIQLYDVDENAPAKTSR